MIAALLFLSMVGWSCWLMFRDVRSSSETTPLAASARSVIQETAVVGLEDDLHRWRAIRGAWTALDEHQLIRLLTDSAPVNRPATNSTGDTVTPVEHEDTA